MPVFSKSRGGGGKNNPECSQYASFQALERLWQQFGLEPDRLQQLKLGNDSALLNSSFKVSSAAQASISACALMAEELYFRRIQDGAYHSQDERQSVHVPLNAAEAECTALFTVDGETPESWAKYSGVYACRDGYIRVHANFDHHRDAFLRMIRCKEGEELSREYVAQRVLEYSASELEDRAVEAGAIIARMRSPEEWKAHPQARAMNEQPVLEIEKINDCNPIPLPALETASNTRPLDNIRVLDLTRILAGPVCTRSLAAYGAKVLTVNSPNLPNIEHIIDTGRGKRSCHLDFYQDHDRKALAGLINDADIFVQSYRPGSLAKLGLDAETLSEMRPGLIYSELSAFGHLGPWANKRGFDSIVQTASGFNSAEAQAYADIQNANGQDKGIQLVPKAFPIQILDFATGFLMAFGSQLALLKRAEEGGSWRVRCSLLQTANWLQGFGRQLPLANAPEFDTSAWLKPFPSEYGELMAMPHAAQFSDIPVMFKQASVKPGRNNPEWW